MAATASIVDWRDPLITPSTTQAVYVRQRWADAWQLQSNLWAIERVWSLLPAMPTATLILHYGRIIPHGGSSYVTQPKLDLRGWYVKIVDTCEDGVLEWVGFIDEVADDQGGISASGIATGTQTFVAYSMAAILNHHTIIRSNWEDPDAGILGSWSESGGTFNENGKGNFDGSSGFTSGHFGSPQGEFWSTKDILWYMLNIATPDRYDYDASYIFVLDNMSLAFDWDRPTLESEGRSSLSILEELVNSSRLIQFSVSVDSTDRIMFRLNSLATTSLTLPNGETFAANDRPIKLYTVGSEDTFVSVQQSLSMQANQVIVRGAQRETCGTFQICESETDTQKLVEAFSSTIVTAYEDGASNHADYASWTTPEKRQANERARARHGVEDAYRVFAVNQASSMAVGAFEYVFENEDSTKYSVWWHRLKFAQQLPFKRGVDYSGTIIEDDTHNDEEKPDDFRGPLILFKRVGTSPAEYLQAEKMANIDRDPIFSIAVGIEYNGACMSLNVQGAEQHAIAHGRFTGQSEDRTTAQLGSWDYREAMCTVSLQEDRFAEGRYPEDDALDQSLDTIRRKVIYVGPSYKLIRVLKDTIVDIDEAGIPQKTTNTAYIRDDREKLKSLAKLAHQWYATTRKVFRLTSARPSARPAVGMMLTKVNEGTAHEEEINTIISEIRLSTPLGENGAVPVASYSITTAMGELDPLAFAPPQPSVPLADQAIAPLVQR